MTDLAALPDDEIIKLARDPFWRIRNLYRVLDKDGKDVLFVPWEEQDKLLREIWYRNIILKARQRGFSTVIQLLMLDTCLFTQNTNAAVIAQDLDAAEVIFRKIKFAYDHLPPIIKQMASLAKDSASELILANNSSLRVATSARSGTLQFLHVSEFGKICAKFPDKAREIITGSLPAVAQTGIAFIESTAEGREGAFYEMTQRAQKTAMLKRPLSMREYKFHFASWWDANEYETDPEFVTITGKEHDYFNKLENLIGRQISLRKRAWYIATRDNEFNGDGQMMLQEYPSTPEEAFSQSTEGVYYAEQMAAARRQGRICALPHDPSVPVNTFWDLGKDDDTAIWFHQKIGAWDHFIDFYEVADAPFSTMVNHMQSLGYTWGRHYLPHDGEQRSWGVEQLKTSKDMLEDLGLRNIEIVPRTPNVTIAIRQCRDAFPKYRFDETRCKAGITHLDNYRKTWNARLGAWTDTPLKNGHQHAADALRQHSQMFQEPAITAGARRKKRPSGMAA
ncbi:phage terminase large subunit [Bradyrhizobium diazoefficiens]|uniref:Phage terminase large subunit n=1 Tax=Bradyrhizobium diazoefficiens TaxID=1355477 RepID=A0A809ZXZ0_9BRAD|nr:hypothetical protein [Bradyrhizobium diazoefficiens]BBZ94309.1 phage terminase large subunit [Bradyrhizobium diazoefficiens]BCE56397.1 phage terminase large subunit [Bradyrhizobium diazoefficiens]